MATDPTQQDHVIVFENVPSHYTVEDILFNHLHKKKNKDLSNKGISRWRRAIRIIELVKHYEIIFNLFCIDNTYNK